MARWPSAACSTRLGELNDSQLMAWQKTISVFDEELGDQRQLALFPADRTLPGGGRSQRPGSLRPSALGIPAAIGGLCVGHCTLEPARAGDLVWFPARRQSGKSDDTINGADHPRSPRHVILPIIFAKEAGDSPLLICSERQNSKRLAAYLMSARTMLNGEWIGSPARRGSQR